MSTIKILAVDPAMANFGMAKFALNLDTLELTLLKLRLVSTKNETKQGGKRKVVRQNSDDLRRARAISEAFQEEVRDCALVFAEIPSGAQAARAAYGFGMQVGILGMSPKPVLEVMPLETKNASVGSKAASKQDMIAWAFSLYPDGEWLRARNSPTGHLVDANEHLADACGIAHAGILTEEFRRLRAAWMSSPLAA